jgi:hypothetical protein
MSSTFKRCSCGRIWEKRHEFLSDPNVTLKGYMAHFEELELGILVFNHDDPGCGTSLGVQAGQFKDLHEGRIFSESKRGTGDCPGHCLHKDNLEACPAACECAWVRDVMQAIRNWPK